MSVWSDRFEIEAEELVQRTFEAIPEALGDQIVEHWINHRIDGQQALAGQKEPLV